MLRGYVYPQSDALTVTTGWYILAMKQTTQPPQKRSSLLYDVAHYFQCWIASDISTVVYGLVQLSLCFTSKPDPPVCDLTPEISLSNPSGGGDEILCYFHIAQLYHHQ